MIMPSAELILGSTRNWIDGCHQPNNCAEDFASALVLFYICSFISYTFLVKFDENGLLL